MIYDWIIIYTIFGVRHEFLASETNAQRAYLDLLDYVDHELEQPFGVVKNVQIECEGPSLIQF